MLRVFKSKWFQRFADREGIPDALLWKAAARAEEQNMDANLGGGVIKQRIAGRGHGRSGGFRTIILYRQGDRAVFVYGFAKSDRENITKQELRVYKDAAAYVLSLSQETLAILVKQGDFVEINAYEQEIQE